MNTKTAIITGAGKGIGKAIALGLAVRGYKTILIGRNKYDLIKVSAEITNAGNVKPDIFELDITNRENIKSVFRQITNAYKKIDVLVNNAGIYIDGTTDISEPDFVIMLDTNLTAQYLILQQIVPVMKQQKSGYIFNVASRSGKTGFAGSGAYSASKFGLVGLSEALYRELNPLGIRVTALCPGWVNTKMAFEAGTPLTENQMIQPDDLFATIDWLLHLSPGACVKEVVLETPFNIS